MNNFFETHDGRFTYYSKPEGECLKVVIYYSKGGGNYFSGGYASRGVYASIRPVERKNGMESCMAFSGISVCVKELNRLNRKAIHECAERIDGIIPEVIELWNPDNKKECIFRILKRFPQRMEAYFPNKVE